MVLCIPSVIINEKRKQMDKLIYFLHVDAAGQDLSSTQSCMIVLVSGRLNSCVSHSSLIHRTGYSDSGELILVL